MAETVWATDTNLRATTYSNISSLIQNQGNLAFQSHLEMDPDIWTDSDVEQCQNMLDVYSTLLLV